MRNYILLACCIINLSMLAQWNSKKISDLQEGDENNTLTFTLKHNGTTISKKSPVIQNDIALDLFPDPSSGLISVPIENNSPQTNVCVYDALGKCVYNEVTVKKNDDIDMSERPKGVYLMEITSGNEKTVKKFVVE